MRRKKHLDRAGGGGGTELFICFTSRPSASGLRPSSSSKPFSPGRGGAGPAAGGGNGSGGAGAADAAPAALLRPSLSRRLRNSGSLKGGQSPMFPPGTASGGRRGRGGMEPAEPSSPKVTCIGQVRVKGGKRKPKHASSSAAALRSRSRRGVGGGLSGSEASFRRGADDRDGAGGLHPGAKNQGWVYQIPVNICEALKTFGSCGGRSLCSPSRDRGGAPRSGAAGDKKRRRAPAGGSWLCGAAVARCLLAIQEEEDDVGKGSAVGPADEARESQVGLVMQGWDVEDDEEEEEDETRVVVGAVEVEKEDEILLVGGKEEEGRVSVCIPPRNALLLMRCRSDPVRMAELATRFWGSPAAATASVGQVDNEGGGGGVEKEEEEEGEANVEKECAVEARNSAVSADGEVCRERGGFEDDGGEAGDAGQVVSEDESSKHGDIGEEANDGGCRGDAEEKDEPVEAQIVRKDVGLEVEAAKSESQAPAMVEAVADTKEDADAPRMEDEVKGRRSVSSCSPSTALKEDRKLRRLGSTRRRVSTSSKASSSSDRVDRRHSFSAEMEARRSSFSSLKDSRRASFSIDRDGRRWSFTIEQEHLVAEPKVLMASRKGKKNSSEAESEKDCPVLVAAPNSVEEAQECTEDGKEEATNVDGEEEGATTQCAEIHTEVQKVETGVDEEKCVVVKQEQRKKSGELPDCLLMMMCEPKLSMEVSKETWVCSTDFVHWKSHQGQNRRQQNAAAAPEEMKDDSSNAPDTSVAKDTEESAVVPAPANPACMPPQAAPKPPTKPAGEQKLKLELPKVAAGVVAAYAPLVLKRCKSEPLRSSARLAPDTCFWKEDRHRPLNATGIGF
ncbi:uncharacterized protein [Aegilops tauschii subsp. strangulata]|uniref:Chloroplast protein HCF243 n=1 Tax=Aegilops tauschii subsp. strangulata TaxID=200361 RepID=A0A452ZXJ5_AEGTS|nr:uncharacterized protein LOC109774637 [Aegilops tauschii subsp. strangulata]